MIAIGLGVLNGSLLLSFIGSSGGNIIITMDALLCDNFDWMVLLFSLVVSGCLLSSSRLLDGLSDLGLLYLLLLDNGSGCLSGHGASKVGSLLELFRSLSNLQVLSGDIIGVFALEIDTNLVVDEGDDHAVVEGDER